MEPKSVATTLTGGSALVGGSIMVKETIPPKVSRKDKVVSIEDLKAPPIDRSGNIRKVLKDGGFVLVTKDDTEILNEILEHVKGYVKHLLFRGTSTASIEILKNHFTSQSVDDLTVEKIPEMCESVLNRTANEGLMTINDAKIWCTKEVSMVSLFKNSSTEKYAPLDTDESNWENSLREVNGRYRDNPKSFSEFKDLCVKWERSDFRRNKDYEAMDWFHACIKLNRDIDRV